MQWEEDWTMDSIFCFTFSASISLNPSILLFMSFNSESQKTQHLPRRHIWSFPINHLLQINNLSVVCFKIWYIDLLLLVAWGGDNSLFVLGNKSFNLISVFWPGIKNSVRPGRNDANRDTPQYWKFRGFLLLLLQSRQSLILQRAVLLVGTRQLRY